MKIKNKGTLDIAELPKTGVQSFSVVDAEEECTKGGVWLKLTLLLKGEDQDTIMYDRIAADDVYKLSAFTESVGCSHWLATGKILPKACIGLTGRIRLYLQKMVEDITSPAYSPAGNGYMSDTKYSPAGNGYVSDTRYAPAGNGYVPRGQ